MSQTNTRDTTLSSPNRLQKNPVTPVLVSRLFSSFLNTVHFLKINNPNKPASSAGRPRPVSRQTVEEPRKCRRPGLQFPETFQDLVVQLREFLQTLHSYFLTCCVSGGLWVCEEGFKTDDKRCSDSRLQLR